MKKVYSIGFYISIVITILAVIVTAVLGMRLGIDFRGGSVLEVEYLEERPAQEEIKLSLESLDFVSDIVIQLTQSNGVILRFSEIDENQHQLIIQKLNEGSSLTEKRFDSIGPVIGQELKRKSIYALIAVFILIVIYIAIAFRKLSAVLSPWKMGGAALIALLHDIAVPVGIFSVLGYLYGIEVGAVFIAAVLTILGYSVSDSVVVFDRIRENVLRYGRDSFGDIVHKSILQTLSRSINTSLTTILSLLAIFLFGGESTRMFSLALIIGISLGTYSSIFVAAPLLVRWSKQ